jgi:long-chain acyl-CoA synthetase
MTALSHIRAKQPINTDIPVYPSLVHMLHAAVELEPDIVAVRYEDRSVTYREFGRAVNGLARQLSAEGVKAGDRVILVMPNSIEMDIALMAVMAAGAQVAPANPFFTVPELKKVLADVDAGFMICAPAMREKAQEAAEALGVATVMTLGAGEVTIDGWIEDAKLDAKRDALPSEDDLALLIFTGGSTGIPKGVDHTHRGLMWSLLQHCSVWPVDYGREMFLNVAPMFHIWGLSYATWVPIYARSTLVMVPKYDPDKVVAALAEHRVTVFSGGPAPIYLGLLASPLFASADLSALKYCLSGGAPCPEELHKQWHARTGQPLLEGWGMTEGAPFCLNPCGDRQRKILSVGNPVPETEVQIVDVETGTHVLPLGEAGEVRVRGPQLMVRYRKNREETERSLRDGWMYTGDIGYVDADGFLFLVDRKKDMILVGGYNVYPREIDEVLFNHPKIREAATVGKRDPRLGEVVVAFVALRQGQRMSEEEFFEYCKQNMVKYKRPVEVHFIDALPRTGTNKINRIALRDRLNE